MCVWVCTASRCITQYGWDEQPKEKQLILSGSLVGGSAARRIMGQFDVLDEGCIWSALVADAVVLFDEMHIVNVDGHANGYPIGPTHIVKAQDFL